MTMFVIKKLRLNKFQNKPIVSNRTLFKAKGECPATMESKDTPDCFDQPTIDGASKTKTLGLASEITKTAIEKHKTAGESKDLDIKNAREY